MDATDLLRMAYEQGVKLALDESLPEVIAAKEAGVPVETAGTPIERPMHHDVPKGQPARFGRRGDEHPHAKQAGLGQTFMENLRADNYLPLLPLATGALGAGAGYLSSDDPEERKLRAMTGAGVGMGLGAIPNAVQDIVRFHKGANDEAEPEYVAKARDYAARYHAKLLSHLKAEHEAKQKPPAPKM